MKNDNEEKLTELLKKADGHPMMKAILAEEASAILAKRTEAAGKIEVLQKERDAVIPRLQADLAEKEGEFNKAKAALDAAGGEFNKAKAALSSEGFQFDIGINREKAVLLETADPLIDETITIFREKFEELRKPGRISSRGMTVETNIFTDTKTLTTETNKDAVLSALAYCQAAIKALETLKLSPILDAEKIERMKSGVPSIEVYTEATGTKPMEKVNTDPFAGLPSDSELNWRKGKLMEKAKKILKR